MTEFRVLERGRGYDHLGTTDTATRTACGRTLNPQETTAVSLAVTGVTCPMCRKTKLYRQAVAAGHIQDARTVDGR